MVISGSPFSSTALPPTATAAGPVACAFWPNAALFWPAARAVVAHRRRAIGHRIGAAAVGRRATADRIGRFTGRRGVVAFHVRTRAAVLAVGRLEEVVGVARRLAHFVQLRLVHRIGVFGARRTLVIWRSLPALPTETLLSRSATEPEPSATLLSAEANASPPNAVLSAPSASEKLPIAVLLVPPANAAPPDRGREVARRFRRNQPEQCTAHRHAVHAAGDRIGTQRRRVATAGRGCKAQRGVGAAGRLGAIAERRVAEQPATLYPPIAVPASPVALLRKPVAVACRPDAAASVPVAVPYAPDALAPAPMAVVPISVACRARAQRGAVFARTPGC